MPEADEQKTRSLPGPLYWNCIARGVIELFTARHYLMKKHFIILLTTLLPLSLCAAEPPVRPDVEELLTLLKVDKQMEQSMNAMRAMMMKSFPMKGDEAQRAADKSFAMVSREFSWEKLKGHFAQIYSEVFTPEEINGLIAFYKSPIGQSFLEKQPLLMEKTMEVTQKKLAELMPKLQAEIQADLSKDKAGAK